MRRSLVSREVVEGNKSHSVMRMLGELIGLGLLVAVARLGLDIGRQYLWKGTVSRGRLNYGITIVPEILTREKSMDPLTSAP